MTQAQWSELFAAARARWPTVTFDDDVIRRFILERGDVSETAEISQDTDLALAAACAAGEPTAHAAFETILSAVEVAGAATDSPRDLIDEVKQILRVQLLVGSDGKPPGITGYRGLGPLRGWIRITATRELIRHKKARARFVPTGDALDTILATTLEPGLTALKAEYRTELAAALKVAIRDLSPEDRTLLRQQLVDHVSIDALGVAYGVHRATAARWVTRAREALVEATHARLAERLQLPVEQMDSVIRLVSSQLDASVIRHLRR